MSTLIQLRTCAHLREEILEPEDRRHDTDDDENEPHDDNLADCQALPAFRRGKVVYRLTVDRRARPISGEPLEERSI